MAEATGDGSGSDSVDSFIRELAAAPPREVPEARPPSLAAGTQLARYALLRPLGQGGMGTVWEAAHVVSGKRVALKILRDDLITTGSTRRRFAREAMLATTVSHPGVVEIHDCFEAENGSPVLVMELLQGETLAALLRRERLAPEEAALIVADVVAIVRAAHEAGVLHRDLKPENIFLCRDGARGPRVRVLDFGIARLLDAAVDPAFDTITQTGAIIGTPQYMAPEQLFGEGNADESADVWAIGVILYECITGSRPIEGNNVARVARNLVRHGVPPLPPGSCPERVRGAVRSMLAVDRDGRPRRLDELERLLRDWAAGKLPRSSFVRWRRSFAAVVAGVALAAAVVHRVWAPPRAPSSGPGGTTLVVTSQFTVATETSRTSTAGKLLEKWRRAIGEHTRGHVALNVRWPGATSYRGGERALVTRLRSSQVDGALLGARGLRLAFPAVAAAELPGLVDSWQKVEWIRAHLREPLRTSSTAEGYELLAFEDEGCERIMTRAHAVRRPQDLAKMRMAALDSDPVAPLIASVVPGILSIPLPSSDVVDAVAAGPRLGISAVVGTAGDAERFQWTKVVDGITRMPVVCASGALVLRSSAYEKLAADERQAVDDVSQQFEEILSTRLRKEDIAASLRLLRSLTVAEPSVDDRTAWQRAFRHAAEQTDGSLPKAMVTQVLALSHEIDVLH